MSVREELIEIVTRDSQSSGGDRVWATDLVDSLLHEEAEKLRKTVKEAEGRGLNLSHQYVIGLIDPYKG